MEQKLAFAILGFDCDNGSEFLNHHLWRYLAKRRRPVKFTRSRPYRKNDNAHTAATPENTGWGLTGGSGTRDIDYATDTVRGKVLHITTTPSGEWDVQYTIGDNPNCEVQNPNDTALAIQDRTHQGVSIKNDNTNARNSCRVVVLDETDKSNKIREMFFTTNAGADSPSDDNILYYIGTGWEKGSDPFCAPNRNGNKNGR